MTRSTNELAEAAHEGAGYVEEAFDAAGELAAGDVIPGTPYTVVRRLGRGGHATVYHCQNAIGRDVAVKVMHAHLARRRDLMDRMIEEARRMVRLDHPNIVQVYNAGITQGAQPVTFIEMELLRGCTGRVLLGRKKAWAIPHALDVLIDLAKALDRAHQMGIVHQDVKPDNIFVEIKDTASSGGPPRAVTKLLDFGISKVLLDATASTPSGRMRAPAGTSLVEEESLFEGTLLYAAPEQLLGGAITPRVDLYALGMIAFEMIVGWRPFEAAETQDREAREKMAFHPDDEALALSQHLIHAILHERMPRLSERAHQLIPRELDELVARLLERDPQKRPATARELANRFVEIRQIKGLQTTVITTEELLGQEASNAPARGKGRTQRMDRFPPGPPPTAAPPATVAATPEPSSALYAPTAPTPALSEPTTPPQSLAPARHSPARSTHSRAAELRSIALLVLVALAGVLASWTLASLATRARATPSTAAGRLNLAPASPDAPASASARH